MTKEILKDYIHACALVHETDEDLERLRRKVKEAATDVVKGSNREHPYQAVTFHIEGVNDLYHTNADIQRLERLRTERKEKAGKIRVDVECWINTIPAKMARIVRLKYFECCTWDTVSAKLGYMSPDAARKELQRFLADDDENSKNL